MTQVKEHTKTINGKKVNVKSYHRKEPVLSASEFNKKNNIKGFKEINNSDYFKKKIDNLSKDLKFIGIGANRKIAKNIVNNKYKKGDIVYVASTPDNYDYKDNLKGTTRAYIYNGNNDVSLLFSNTNNHRAKIALKNYEKYRKGEIKPEIWNNYITNGYNTSRGLFRSDKNFNNIKKIQLSHSDYLGNESGNSKIDHLNRVKLRN